VSALPPFYEAKVEERSPINAAALL